MKIKLKEGDHAPDFECTDQDGEIRSLKDYSGKYLLLYFYPRDNTPGCTKEACSFRDIYDELVKYVVVVGVSGDSEKSHTGFIEKHNLPFTLLADSKKEIINAYGANGVFYPRRVSFLIDPAGTIIKIYENINAGVHPEEVLSDVSEL